MKACGLAQIPDRRTFDRRLKAISMDIKERIAVMTSLFVHENMLENKGIVPRSGIDTDARWGFSHTKGWIFGYKLHI